MKLDSNQFCQRSISCLRHLSISFENVTIRKEFYSTTQTLLSVTGLEPAGPMLVTDYLSVVSTEVFLFYDSFQNKFRSNWRNE